DGVGGWVVTLLLGVGTIRSSLILISSKLADVRSAQKPTFVPNSGPGTPSEVTDAEPAGPETDPVTRSPKNVLMVSEYVVPVTGVNAVVASTVVVPLTRLPNSSVVDRS